MTATVGRATERFRLCTGLKSADEIDVYIACGEIGGVVAPDGSLTIGLGEQEDSGYTGIAYLAPGADGASTDVTVFLAETGGRDGNANDEDSSATEDSVAADDEGVGGDSAATPEAMDSMDMDDEATPNP